MRMVASLSLSLGCMFLSVNLVHAQSADRKPPIPAVYPYPQPVPTDPYAPFPAVLPPSVARPPASTSGKGEIDHLAQAARHLEAAGLGDEAADIRQRAEVARTKHQLDREQQELARNKALLTEKLEKLRALSAEVDRLRKSVEGPQQVQINVKIIELSTDKMRAHGIDFRFIGDQSACGCPDDACPQCQCPANLEAECPCNDGGECVGASILAKEGSILSNFIAWAAKHGLVSVLSSPQLITESGKPASLFTGGEIPVLEKTGDGDLRSIRYVKSGISVDVVPVVLETGDIQLELRAAVSKVTGETPDGNPCVNRREIDAGVKVAAGQTLVLRAGDTASCDASSSNAAGDVLLLVTPKIVPHKSPGRVTKAIPATYVPQAYPRPAAQWRAPNAE